MVVVSQKFKVAVKLGDRPAYRYAQAAGMDSTLLSKILNGIVPTRKNDSRVIAVGRVLGLQPEKCFQDVSPMPHKRRQAS